VAQPAQSAVSRVAKPADAPIPSGRLPDLPAPSAPNQVWRGDFTYVTTVPFLVECSS